MNLAIKPGTLCGYIENDTAWLGIFVKSKSEGLGTDFYFTGTCHIRNASKVNTINDLKLQFQTVQIWRNKFCNNYYKVNAIDDDKLINLYNALLAEARLSHDGKGNLTYNPDLRHALQRIRLNKPLCIEEKELLQDFLDKHIEDIVALQDK